MTPRPMKIFLVAGEASADLHGAALLAELKKIHPDLHCFGVGGSELKKSGMNVVVEAHSLSIVGLGGLGEKFGEILKSLKKLKSLIKDEKPDIAVLLDLPDFNLHLAKFIRKQKIPVVYYISPQVWAWRGYRVHRIRRDVKKMLVLFPFEKKFYAEHKIPAEFVGHPLLERIQPRKTYRSQTEIAAAPRIALLPGSRRSEVGFHSPILKELMEKVRSKYPAATFQIPVASTVSRDQFELFQDPAVELIDGNAHSVVRWSDLAVVASGTATLETALIGTPLALFYVISRSNAFVFKHIARYRGFLGMPNLLLGEEVIKEFFQEKAKANLIFPEIERLIENEAYRLEMTNSLRQCRSLLGAEGASRRAAFQVFQTLTEKISLSGLSFAPKHA